MERTDVVIAGGGIGGLAAAVALARTGRTVRVLERAAEFGEVGAGIQLAPNATRVLAGLGVLDRVLEVGVLPRRLVMADALTLEELTHLPLGDFGDRYGGPYVVLHRSDLLRILLDAARAAGVLLHTGTQVLDVDQGGGQDGEPVVVRCAGGRAFSASVLVGADGLHSRLRALFTDDAVLHSGYVAYRGAVPMERVERHADLRDVVVWLGPGLHLVQYPLRSGRMYNQVAVFRSDRWAAGDPDWGTPEELDAAFAGAADHVRESIRLLGRDHRWPMLDRAPLATWVRGRVALLGDAAHPMLQYLAQGACQALQDAEALAAALDATDDVPAALLAYQGERVPQAASVQRTARVWGDIWHVDGLTRDLRNEMLRTRDPQDHHHVTWLYGRSPRPVPAGAPALPGVSGTRGRA